MLTFETNLWKSGFGNIAGVDEVGRGPLAGPVVAVAVVFPSQYFNDSVNDSKKLTVQKRIELYNILVNEAITWGIGIVDNFIIDTINILNATLQAMQEAISLLTVKPDFILVDGNRFYKCNIPYKAIVKGDSKSFTIAAASIIAKVTRDKIMENYSEKYPLYNFHKHKGYGTKEHIELIKKYGRTEIHRTSFKLKGIDY
jgi:ribonuclease HII